MASLSVSMIGHPSLLTSPTNILSQVSVTPQYTWGVNSIAALDLKAKQLAELNVCWNSVYRRLFGFHKWESVRGCISGMGRLDFIHVSQLAKVKFYLKIVSSTNSVMHNVFWAYLSHNFACVFKSRNAVLAKIYDDFVVQ